MNRLEVIKEMLNENPGDPFLHYALALETEKTNRPGEAVILLEKMMVDFPEYLPVYYKLGKLIEKESKIERAIEVYKRGIELAKKQHELKTLGELNEALNQLED